MKSFVRLQQRLFISSLAQGLLMRMLLKNKKNTDVKKNGTGFHFSAKFKYL
jgi:hypothetical protein